MKRHILILYIVMTLMVSGLVSAESLNNSYRTDLTCVNIQSGWCGYGDDDVLNGYSTRTDSIGTTSYIYVNYTIPAADDLNMSVYLQQMEGEDEECDPEDPGMCWPMSAGYAIGPPT